MFKYDTTHGPYKGHVESAPGALIVDGHNIQSFSEKYALPASLGLWPLDVLQHFIQHAGLMLLC